MMHRFLQIHFLTSYPASLLNRDDAGFAKRMPFGGASRTRISSQCLKRHWRTFEGDHSLASLGAPGSVRSRRTFERYVLAPLSEEVDPALALAATEALMKLVLGESNKARQAKADNGEESGAGSAEGQARTGQITVLGHPELDYMRTLARQACADAGEPKTVEKALSKLLGRDGKKNLQALKLAAGLDAALFGRMVTSDILARGDAAIHVAHAFTVHEEAAEADYFSAVDDLLSGEDELGSGHIGSSELTSGLFYGYVVVDVPLLVSNLEGCARSEWESADRDLAGKVVTNLVHLVATVSPGAKLGSTAPYAYAHMVLLESGNAQPRTLANAFLDPVREPPSLLGNAYSSLGRHLLDLDTMYGPTERACAGVGPMEEFLSVASTPRTASLAEAASWAGEQVRGTHG